MDDWKKIIASTFQNVNFVVVKRIKFSNVRFSLFGIIINFFSMDL